MSGDEEKMEAAPPTPEAAPGGPTPKKHKPRGPSRKLVGRVTNNTSNPGRAHKTVVVEVVRRFRDPFYGKYVKKRKHLHAHDEKEEYRTRDLVEITESRPLSKTKRWVVTRLVDRPPEV